MNKHLLSFLTIFLLLFLSSTQAQQGFKLGGFFLPQGSFLLNETDSNLPEAENSAEMLEGIGIGLLAGYNFNDNFGIRANLIYSQEGERYRVKRDDVFSNKYVTRLDYLKIPVMIGYNADPYNNKVLLSLYAGPQISFLTRGVNFNDNTDFDPGIPLNYSNFPATSSTYDEINYGIAGDFGVDIYLTPEAVMNLHIRADYSLNDVEDKEVSFTVMEGGETFTRTFWPSDRAATNALNVGLLIGVTYTLGGYR